MIIFADFTFEAAHRLPNVPEGHKCGRLHGHTYQVRIEVTGEPDPHTGFVIDYYDVANAFRTQVFDRLDHRYLNEIEGLDNPTTEILIRWMWRAMKPQLSGLSRVEVREALAMGVAYEGD